MATIARVGVFAFGGGKTLPIKPIVAATYERTVTTGVVTVTLAAHGYKKGEQVFFKASAGTNPPILGLYTITSATTDTFTFVDAVTVTAISASTACLLGGGGYGGPGLELLGIFEDATQAAAAITVLKAGTLGGQGSVVNFENGVYFTAALTLDY
jgi:hypothetical protein